MRQHQHSRHNDQVIISRLRGYSLIELMITMLIGLIILNGVVQVIFTSKRSQLDHKEISFIQENARFALDILSRDIRMAGYLGCSNNNTEQVNVIKNDVMGFIGTAGISGFEGDAGTASFPSNFRQLVAQKTDSLLIRRGESEQEYLVRYQNPHTQQIDLWQDHELEANQPLALIDGSCRHSALFTASALPSSKTLKHSANSNNCHHVLRGDYECQECISGHCPNTFPSMPFLAGARLMPLISHAYFIGESSLVPGSPALKRQSMVTHNGQITTRTEELATGIENMQFSYGIDPDDDGVVNEYRSANNMDVDNNGTTDSDDWEKVKAVKISLLLISQSTVFSQPQTVVFEGIEYLGLFMRQVVSTTIQIRNQNS